MSNSVEAGSLNESVHQIFHIETRREESWSWLAFSWSRRRAVGAALPEEGDSVGGVIECIGKNIPAGLGEPFFDSIESLVSHLIFSIGGVRGIEFGSGFESSRMKGSVCNDVFIDEKGKTVTNNCGGINGGISNGNDIIFRVAIKPTPSISKLQNTYSFKDEKISELSIKGRHDTAFVLRVPVIIEAVFAIAMVDLYLRNRVVIL